MRTNLNLYRPAFSSNINKTTNIQNILKKYEILHEPDLKPSKVFNTREDFEIMNKVNKSLEKIRDELKIKSQKSNQNANETILD